MIGRVIGFFEDAWFLVVGEFCPICGAYCWRWCHNCLKNLPAKEAVELITHKVRNLLDDEPADQFVHTAYEAIDTLEKAFQSCSTKENQ